MKSVKPFLFVLVFSVILLAGCTTIINEAPAEDAMMEDTSHDAVMKSDDAMMESDDAVMEEDEDEDEAAAVEDEEAAEAEEEAEEKGTLNLKIPESDTDDSLEFTGDLKLKIPDDEEDELRLDPGVMKIIEQ